MYFLLTFRLKPLLPVLLQKFRLPLLLFEYDHTAGAVVGPPKSGLLLTKPPQGLCVSRRREGGEELSRLVAELEFTRFIAQVRHTASAIVLPK